MIISKQALQVVNLCSKDKDIPVLDNVCIDEAGNVIGASRNAILIVSPTRREIKKSLHLKETRNKKEISISSESAKKILKVLPTDTLFKGLLEHCDIDDQGGRRVFVSLHDGKQEFSIGVNKFLKPYIKYRDIIKSALTNKSSQRVVLNRSRLKLLLETIEKVCPDSSGESPIYLEFTNNNDIIVRSKNLKTGQMVLGTMKSHIYNKETWLSNEKWENSLFTKVKKVFRRKNK